MSRNIPILQQDISERIVDNLKQTNSLTMSIFARTCRENYRLYHGHMKEYFPPTEHTLHQAIKNGATCDTVLSLIKFFPEMPCPGGYGSLLHFAVWFKSHIDVINYIIQHEYDFYPEKQDTVPIHDKDGNMPLHIAILNAHESKPTYIVMVINALLCAFPGSINCDKIIDNGDTYAYTMAPLHLAIHTYAGLEVIQTLISYDRQVVSRHSRHPDFRVSGYESDESDMNGDGWVLPVHLAAWNSTPVKVVQVLVESYPPSIVKQDQEHNRAP
jgi:hypothetical protein